MHLHRLVLMSWLSVKSWQIQFLIFQTVNTNILAVSEMLWLGLVNKSLDVLLPFAVAKRNFLSCMLARLKGPVAGQAPSAGVKPKFSPLIIPLSQPAT
jgi:hypothetical protein